MKQPVLFLAVALVAAGDIRAQAENPSANSCSIACPYWSAYAGLRLSVTCPDGFAPLCQCVDGALKAASCERVTIAEVSADDSCPVTQPNGESPPAEMPSANHHGGYGILADLWPNGTVVFRESGPGSIGEDGALSMKWPWWRGVTGQLEITGRRLDGAARPLRARIPKGYGDVGFQSTALIFPTEGCWEVTGRVGEASLSFVTRVVRDAKPGT